MPIAVIEMRGQLVVSFFDQSICCFFATFEAGIYPGIARTRDFCELCTTFIPVPELYIFVLSVGYTQNHTRGITPGITLQTTSVTPVGHLYPNPELLEVLYAGATKTPSTGTACLYMPGTSGSYVRPCHNTRKFWKFGKTFIPVPGTSGSSVRLSYPYPELL